MIQNQDTPLAGQYLSFFLQEKLFALPIDIVLEINQLPEITSIPSTPSAVVGVIQTRQRVASLIDLRIKFGMEAPAFRADTCMIVIEGEDGPMAIVVDAVGTVVQLSESDIEDTPTLGLTPHKAEIILGLGNIAGKLVVLINMVACLRDESLMVLDEISMADTEQKTA